MAGELMAGGLGSMWVRAALAAIILCTSTALSAADERCSIPESLADPNAELPASSFAVQRTHRLDVLVLSSTPSQTGAAKGLRSYPSFFEAALKGRLPGVEIHVAVRSAKRYTVMELQPSLPALLEETKPNLVIWQGGTVELYRGIDPNIYGNALHDGVLKLSRSGIDIVLVDMQYSPRTSRLVDSAAYVENMRRVAETFDIPFFNRYEIMRHWSDSGAFDLSALGNDGLFEKIHFCLGRLLADFVVRGALLTNYKAPKP